MQIKLSLICCLTFILLISLDEYAAEEDINFKVFWNVPSYICSKKYGINVTESLRKFGVLVNTAEKFRGDSITIFYAKDLGLYPRIEEGSYINGGHPQLSDMNKHLEKAKNDIETKIPSKDFDGLAVIDWESWRPVWEYNWGGFQQYQTISRELVKEQHPNWSVEEVDEKAAAEWEEAAKVWMLDTLLMGKTERPLGKWCYYLFPDCYNYKNKDQPDEYLCRESVVAGNNKLRWLWETSTALCPSIYLHKKKLDATNFTQRIWFTHGRLAEALRVRSSDVPIYPYINYFPDGSDSTVPEEDFYRMMAQTAGLGMEGVVVWGSSFHVASQEDCNTLDEYVTSVIGPATQTITKNVLKCAETVCKGQGRCAWFANPYSGWRELTNPSDPHFSFNDITCTNVSKQ
ncbi:hyaluronidase-1-like [Tachypleus tridentatus]|uniref:hyaluronidase-1-like n=1 Tax=Tachypleus tridentatus TaxID=6853 RepID=UPI003FCF4073